MLFDFENFGLSHTHHVHAHAVDNAKQTPLDAGEAAVSHSPSSGLDIHGTVDTGSSMNAHVDAFLPPLQSDGDPMDPLGGFKFRGEKKLRVASSSSKPSTSKKPPKPSTSKAPSTPVAQNSAKQPQDVTTKARSKNYQPK